MMLGIGEAASARCLITPTQLTTYSGRKADRIASSAAKVRHIDARNDIVPLEQFDAIKGRLPDACADRAEHAGETLPQRLKHLVPEHAGAAQHHDLRDTHEATSVRAQRMYSGKPSSMGTIGSNPNAFRASADIRQTVAHIARARRTMSHYRVQTAGGLQAFHQIVNTDACPAANIECSTDARRHAPP